MAVGDIYRTQLFYHATQRQFINQFHYRETVEDTGPDPCQALAQKLADTVLLDLETVTSEETTLGCVKVDKIIGTSQPSGVVYFLDKLGDRLGQAVPGNVGLRLNMNGQNHSRANRGAVIIGGLTELDLTNGNWDNSLLTGAMASWITSLLLDVTTTAPNSGTFELGYMSRANAVAGQPPVTWPGVFIRPDSITAQGNPVSIRSRQTTHTNASST